MPKPMKIEMGKEYKTRDGRPVRVLCVDGADPTYPVIAMMPGGGPMLYTATGRLREAGPAHDLDLIGEPELHELFIPVHRDWNLPLIYESKESAQAVSPGARVLRVAYCLETGEASADFVYFADK